jgi:uncharacterized membrane protein
VNTQQSKRFKIISKYVLGLLFILAGVNHFINPALYVGIMPPYLPWHLSLVYLSGIFEILFGTFVFVPKWTKVSAWGLILLLIAVFPANLHMALNTRDFSFIPALLLWLRLPFQAVLIIWAYWHTRSTR